MVWNVLRNEKLRLLPSDVSLAQLRANMKNLHDWHYDADSISWHLQMLKMKITLSSFPQKETTYKVWLPSGTVSGSKERNSQQNEKKKKPVNNRCKASGSDKSTVQKHHQTWKLFSEVSCFNSFFPLLSVTDIIYYVMFITIRVCGR